jgi:hypothetical protein
VRRGSASRRPRCGFTGSQERLGRWSFSSCPASRPSLRRWDDHRLPVIVAAIVIGLQGTIVLLFAGFLWLVGSAWERDKPVPHIVNVELASIALLGALLIIGAIMMLSGSYRWAIAVAVYDVLLIALPMALQLWKPFDAVSHRSVSHRSVLSPGGLIVLIGLYSPLILLLLPASRRWFRRRATEAA